jgi:hypothetical protein
VKDGFNLKPYYIMSAINIVLLAITSFAGLFISSTYVNFVEPLHLAESQGQDFTTLFVGVPLLVVAMIWTRRGLIRGPSFGRGHWDIFCTFTLFTPTAGCTTYFSLPMLLFADCHFFR